MQTKISLKEIPLNKSYEGYLWWSDHDAPDVYFDQPLESLTNKPIWPLESNNPFIIEGNLWCKAEQTSYLIRFIDGQYFAYRFVMETMFPNEQITEHCYLPNRMPLVEKLLFKEVWLAQEDALCEGFEVLKPTYIAFVGFKK